MKRVLISKNDYKKLDKLIVEAPQALKGSEIFKEFKSLFLAAVPLPRKSISVQVVTMNSKIKLRKVGSHQGLELTITYPQEANVHEEKISVFSDMGIALLGRELGDIVSWLISGKLTPFEIIDVTQKRKS